MLFKVFFAFSASSAAVHPLRSTHLHPWLPISCPSSSNATATSGFISSACATANEVQGMLCSFSRRRIRQIPAREPYFDDVSELTTCTSQPTLTHLIQTFHVNVPHSYHRFNSRSHFARQDLSGVISVDWGHFRAFFIVYDNVDSDFSFSSSAIARRPLRVRRVLTVTFEISRTV